MSDFNEKNNVSIDPAAFAVALSRKPLPIRTISVFTPIFSKNPLPAWWERRKRPLSSWILTSTSSPARTVLSIENELQALGKPVIVAEMSGEYRSAWRRARSVKISAR